MSYDFTVTRDTRLDKVIQWKAGNPPAVVSLVGYSASMTIDQLTHPEKVIAILTTAGSGSSPIIPSSISINTSTNKITISLSVGQVNALPLGVYNYSLILTGPTTKELLSGYFEVKEN